MGKTVIDLIRHGEPVGGRLYRGQIDHPLSEKGWKQMWIGADQVSPEDDQNGRRWDRIVASPLLRCAEFAQALSDRDQTPVTLDSRLMEVGFGQWEGKSGKQIDEDDPTARQRFYQDPVHARPQDAEPLDAFVGRVATAWDEICERHRGERVLLVVHAGVIRAAITHVLQMPLSHMYRVQVANASVTRVIDDGERPPTLHFHGREVRPVGL